MPVILGEIDASAEFVMRLLVAMILGGLVGMERQTRGRPAGLRTNILVCLGSAAVVVAFQKFTLELNVGAQSVIRMDPARAAAGVITGIGFLGAGTIIKGKDFVRGLTTAASIWVVSAIGVTVGLGEFVIGGALTVLVVVSLYVLHRLPISTDHYFSLSVKWRGEMELLDELIEELKSAKVLVKSRRVVCQPKTKECRAMLGLRMRTREHNFTIFDRLRSDERYDEVAWS